MPHTPTSSGDSETVHFETAPSSVTASDTTPKAVSTTVISNIRIETEPLSPALSGFTFNIDPEPIEPDFQLDLAFLPEVESLSFHEPLLLSFPAVPPHAVSPETRENLPAESAMIDPVARSESAAKRLSYFNNAFSNGEPSKETARERVQKDSPIIAELRTNVIIKDEYTMVTSLSQHLSERYRRPESSVLLTVTHSACLMMGGSFEPAYILDVTAIPNEIQPVTNKRNAYLIQCFLADVLHVPSNRGLIRFQGLEEDRLATNGSTVAGDIERAEKEVEAMVKKDDRSPGLVRSLTNKSSRKSMIAEKRKSMVNGTGSERRNKDKDHAETNETFSQSLHRKLSTRSLRSVKSLKLKDTISPPMPIDMPSELLGSPTSIHGFNMALQDIQPAQPKLPKIHRLSPLHGLSGSKPPRSAPTELPSPPKSPLAQHPPLQSPPAPPPPPPPEPEAEPLAKLTSATRRPSLSVSAARPLSARKNLSNITGLAGAIPSPPPIPVDVQEVSTRLSKRKSFVALFQRKGDGAAVKA